VLPQRTMRVRGAALLLALEGSLALGTGCGRDQDSSAAPAASAVVVPAPSASATATATIGTPAAPIAPTPPPAAQQAPSDCGHIACADNLFVDSTLGGPCTAGSVCTLKLTLVATGNFHVNDEYPYRFKADEAQTLTFLGTDEGGKNVFSKGAGDWKKLDEKSGAMTVKFTALSHGPVAINGVFKLSVCSGATCQLEQSRLSARVAVN
jgi:hypothetical protein